VQGQQGQQGFPGPEGPQGIQGIQGPQGQSIQVKYVVADSTALAGITGQVTGDGAMTQDNGHLHVWNGSAWIDAGPVMGPQGPVGPQGNIGPEGAQGDPGIQGIAGPQGPTGATGAQGAPGSVGPMGPMGATGPAGQTGATGATGQTGAQGPSGAIGPMGQPGPQGPAGIQGPQGNVGPTGQQGIEGPPGATGPQGPAGPGINFNSLSAGGVYSPWLRLTNIVDNTQVVLYVTQGSNPPDATTPTGALKGYWRVIVVGNRVFSINGEGDGQPYAIEGNTVFFDTSEVWTDQDPEFTSTYITAWVTGMAAADVTFALFSDPNMGGGQGARRDVIGAGTLA